VSQPNDAMPMRARDIVDHLLLAALWGASFLFMRIAAPEFGPVPLMGLRCVIGALTLLALLHWTSQLANLKERAVMGMIVGVINSAIPFVLLAYASLTITSGVLSVINALAPLWGALVGWLWLRTPLTAWQALGLLLGFSGVAVLMFDGGNILNQAYMTTVLAIGAGVLATLFYGIAVNVAKQYLPGTKPLVNATNSQIGAVVVLLPLTVLLWPSTPISNLAWGSVLVLGIFCTGVAYVLFFRLISNIGAGRAITVVFVIPLFATVFGVLFLQEAVSVVMIPAALLIVIGSALSLRLLPKP